MGLLDSILRRGSKETVSRQPIPLTAELSALLRVQGLDPEKYGYRERTPRRGVVRAYSIVELNPPYREVKTIEMRSKTIEIGRSTLAMYEKP